MDLKLELKFLDGGGSNYIGYFGIFSSFIFGNINDFVLYNVEFLILCDINLIDLKIWYIDLFLNIMFYNMYNI